MILPSKHIKISESFVGLGGVLLSLLQNEPCSIDYLWNKYNEINNTSKCPAYHNFDNVIKAINLLFMVGAIDTNNRGEIIRK